MNEQYQITREQAEKIPMFYHPELAHADLPRGISHAEHDLDVFPPEFKCIVEPRTRCLIKLTADAPLISSVALNSDNHVDFGLAKQRLEEIFGFKLD